jgi:hypothetical protein
MTQQEFQTIQKQIFDEVLQMCVTKGQEYASNSDRFSNFKEVAKDIGINPVQVLMVFVTKHIRSIEQYVRTGKTLSNETTHSRIIDIITYMTLLEGLIRDLNSVNTQDYKGLEQTIDSDYFSGKFIRKLADLG